MPPWTRHESLSAMSFSLSDPEPIADEEDICRVCRGEATPEQPLMHPWYTLFSFTKSLSVANVADLFDMFIRNGNVPVTLLETREGIDVF